MKKYIPVLVLALMAYVPDTMAQSAPALPPNQLTLPKGNYTIPLHWKGDSLHGSWEPHAALLVPVYLPGCPKKFYMQFDTGSPYSLFYGNKLAAIHRKYPATPYGRASHDTLTGFSFKAGSLPVRLSPSKPFHKLREATSITITAKTIALQSFDSSGINWQEAVQPEVIGTLGTDLIENKVIVIDYPHQLLWIGNSIPAAFRHRYQPTPFMFAMRRILLPAALLHKRTMLYFVTGSSAFELLTDKATCLTLAADSNARIQYPVQSWSKTLTANTVITSDIITIAHLSIPLHHATWIEGVSATQVNQMMKMGMGGMTGNKLFLSYALVLDTKRQQAGLIPVK